MFRKNGKNSIPETVTCSRCKTTVHIFTAITFDWKVVTYVTPILRHIKQKYYCEFCKDNLV